MVTVSRAGVASRAPMTALMKTRCLATVEPAAAAGTLNLVVVAGTYAVAGGAARIVRATATISAAKVRSMVTHPRDCSPRSARCCSPCDRSPVGSPRQGLLLGSHVSSPVTRGRARQPEQRGDGEDSGGSGLLHDVHFPPVDAARQRARASLPCRQPTFPR